MKLQFVGAARQVTGSRYLLRVPGASLLVDCGLFQEREYLGRNWERFRFLPERLRGVLLTHAHVDHCGLLPRLVAQGFDGVIWATAPTVDLAEILLADTARIQEEDAAYKKRRHQREGRRGPYPEVPLYTQQDAQRTMRYFRPVEYDTPVQVAPGVRARWLDAGHILGSAMILLEWENEGRPGRLLFSGDLGQKNKPLIRDPRTVDWADFIVMESTYGDRDHPAADAIGEQLQRIIRRTIARGGNVVIPTFAVERAQELLYHLARLVQAGKLPRELPVFLDSPMAVDVTRLFRKHSRYLDAESRALIASGQGALRFPGLVLARSVEQSKAINDFPRPCVIMATSGMCTAGRIKHHLRRNLPRPECTVLFVGYQAHGTLGRQVLQRPELVRIHGRMWPVRAEVEQLFGLSAHADRSGLLQWLSCLRRPPRQVFLTHGEEEAAQALAQEIRRRWGWNVLVPEYGQQVELDGPEPSPRPPD